MSQKADATRDRVTELVRDPLSALGVDVEAVEITPAGKRRVLRIAVDADGGVTLDHVADATRAVSEVLDDSDAMGAQPYTLEVTSRGVDRPLTLARHWRRNATRLVRVTLVDESVVVGRITSSSDDAVVLDVDGAPRELTWAEIEKALVQVEFNRPRAAAQQDDGQDADDADDTDDMDDEDDDLDDDEGDVEDDVEEE